MVATSKWDRDKMRRSEREGKSKSIHVLMWWLNWNSIIWIYACTLYPARMWSVRWCIFIEWLSRCKPTWTHIPIVYTVHHTPHTQTHTHIPHTPCIKQYSIEHNMANMARNKTYCTYLPKIKVKCCFMLFKHMLNQHIFAFETEVSVYDCFWATRKINKKPNKEKKNQITYWKRICQILYCFYTFVHYFIFMMPELISHLWASENVVNRPYVYS